MLLFTLVSLSLIIWLFLLLFRGQFWQAQSRIDRHSLELKSYPLVCAVIPARDEAEAIATSINSLLTQEYSGELFVVLVDDNSSDRTAELAQKTAQDLAKPGQFKLITGKPLEPDWKGKLWAVNQGIDYARQNIKPDYFLLTDGDICHGTNNIQQLVTKAQIEKLDLVSLMVWLRCQSFWEKLLIPAFVFFFQKLYPFPWVNDPQKPTAAAAGGCILISDRALSDLGGIATIKDALIDDCTLAKAVKAQNKKIWLGLTTTTISLRSYNDLKTIWDTIARTAFAQLNYSWLLLIGTLFGMSLVYLTAPIGLTLGIGDRNWLVVGICLLTWVLMTVAYLPTIKLYNLSIIWALALPAIAFLYTLITIDSAIKYYQGKGGAWKGRTYSRTKLDV